MSFMRSWNELPHAALLSHPLPMLSRNLGMPNFSSTRLSNTDAGPESKGGLFRGGTRLLL